VDTAGLDALRRCAGDPDRFAADVWGRAPLQHRAGASGFDDLLSFDDVDHIVASSGLRLPAFRLVKDGATLPQASYTKTTRTGSHAATGVVDPPAIFREFADGATIVLQGMHRWWAPVARFCRHLESALGHPVQANAYITPPGAQGLAIHEDEHDAFVLQSHGGKHWQVYGKGDRPPSGEPLIETELLPGDSLYIPRGWPHAASTRDDASVHLTVGILSFTWLTALREIVKLAEEDPWFAEPLPLRFSTEPDVFDAALRQRLTGIGDWVAKVDADRLGGRLRHRFLTERQPVLPGQLRQLLDLDSLGDISIVRRRNTTLCAMAVDGDELSVLLGDRELRMPSWLGPAMERLASGQPVAVADLAAHLDEAGRLVLVRRLVVEGLLEVVG
jgi:hypothetical protein